MPEPEDDFFPCPDAERQFMPQLAIRAVSPDKRFLIESTGLRYPLNMACDLRENGERRIGVKTEGKILEGSPEELFPGGKCHGI